MSAPLPDAAATEPSPPTLADLRAEIDHIDDSIHDLLMRRAGVVKRVSRLGKVSFRPGREASMIHRLLDRHAGPLPRVALARLWREMFAAHIAIETRFAISVCEATADGKLAAVAREQFGALTPLRVHSTPEQAIADVAARAATVAVLPMPLDLGPPDTQWWVPRAGAPRVHIAARLPYWVDARPEGAPCVPALAVAAASPDPSGDDRSYIACVPPGGIDGAGLRAAFASSGLAAGDVVRQGGAGGAALVDVQGYVAEGDPRLASLARVVANPVVLGCYAVPITGAA